MRFINNLDYLAMAVIGGLKVISGTVNLGDVQAMLQYTNQFAQPITNISNMMNTIQATVASAERIFEVLDEEELVELPLASVKVTDSMVSTPPFIRFDQVGFSYIMMSNL